MTTIIEIFALVLMLFNVVTMFANVCLWHFCSRLLKTISDLQEEKINK